MAAISDRRFPHTTPQGLCAASDAGHRDRQEQVWVGSNDGTVQIVQAEVPFAKLGAVHIGANSDELAYDPEHKIILATSPDATTGSTPTPFVTLIDARPSSHHAILAKIPVPRGGSASLEQPQWDAESGMFVESVRHRQARRTVRSWPSTP
jgi:hypothetical protein